MTSREFPDLLICISKRKESASISIREGVAYHIRFSESHKWPESHWYGGPPSRTRIRNKTNRNSCARRVGSSQWANRGHRFTDWLGNKRYDMWTNCFWGSKRKKKEWVTEACAKLLDERVHEGRHCIFYPWGAGEGWDVIFRKPIWKRHGWP